jgi:hypothetical protein
MGISRRLRRQKAGPPRPKSRSERLQALVAKMRDNTGYQVQDDDGTWLMAGAILPGREWKKLMKPRS